MALNVVIANRLGAVVTAASDNGDAGARNV
jgi:hypothetical protein